MKDAEPPQWEKGSICFQEEPWMMIKCTDKQERSPSTYRMRSLCLVHGKMKGERGRKGRSALGSWVLWDLVCMDLEVTFSVCPTWPRLLVHSHRSHLSGWTPDPCWLGRVSSSCNQKTLGWDIFSILYFPLSLNLIQWIQPENVFHFPNISAK